jgi:sulfur transfer protein SufE
VQQNGIQHTFKPGWQWTTSYNQIIQYGKRLKAQLDAFQQQPAPIL